MRVYQQKTIFRGHVQGVGFRYQTVDIAKGFDVSGYVKNELDGSVVLVAEGEEDEVKAFVEEVKGELASFIKEFDENGEIRDASHRGFRIH